jgi:Tol biopolymer transport system component
MRTRILALIACAGVLALAATAAAAPTVTRADKGPGGVQSNAGAGNVGISASGRFVLFTSAATNLVGGDTNGFTDVFVRDRRKRMTLRVNRSSAGAQANGGSGTAQISGNGRYVAFVSDADNLVPGDLNGDSDIFVRDRKLGRTIRVSVSTGGAEADGSSDSPSISHDGRFVAFTSYATNLVAGDTNLMADVFVRDRKQRKTYRVSVGPGGVQANGESTICNAYAPAVSRDGLVVAFESTATNLIGSDTNGVRDVFVRDRSHKRTSRMNVGPGGSQSADSASYCSLSGSGRRVVFESDGDDLVAGDTNDETDVFVRDRRLRKTIRASVRSNGRQANDWHGYAGISPDGRFVTFQGPDSNIVPGDTNGSDDVFVRDLRNKITKRISRSNQTTPNGSGYAWISEGGRFVTWESDQTNHVQRDTNGFSDVFVRGPFRWPR